MSNLNQDRLKQQSFKEKLAPQVGGIINQEPEPAPEVGSLSVSKKNYIKNFGSFNLANIEESKSINPYKTQIKVVGDIQKNSKPSESIK